MRLTSWLELLRNRLLGRSVPRARHVSRSMARVTEALEQRTLLSAEYSLELIRRDSMEGAATGSQEVGQLARIHTEGWAPQSGRVGKIWL